MKRLCFWGLLPACIAAAAAADDALPAPADLVRRVETLYRAASSYEAAGRVVIHMIRPEEGIEASTEASFSVRLARPRMYRITWLEQNVDVPSGGAVWNDGEGPRLYLSENNAYRAFDSDAVARSAAAGPSFAVSKIIPDLFYPEEGRPGLLSRLQHPEVVGREEKQDTPCYILGGDLPNGVVYRFWIATNDLHIVQIENALGGSTEQHAVPEPTPEQEEETLRAVGMEVTEENREKVRSLMAEARAVMASVRGTARQVHERAGFNVPMGPDDVALELPAGAVLKERSPEKGGPEDSGVASDP